MGEKNLSLPKCSEQTCPRDASRAMQPLCSPGSSTHQSSTSGFTFRILASIAAKLPSHQKAVSVFTGANVLQKLNLTQSQKHSLGFTTRRSREAPGQRTDLFSTSLQSFHCPEMDVQEGCEQHREELHGGQDQGLKYRLWPLQLRC